MEVPIEIVNYIDEASVIRENTCAFAMPFTFLQSEVLNWVDPEQEEHQSGCLLPHEGDGDEGEEHKER